MKNSNTPHSSDNKSESALTPKTYVRSKARVFFVRHGESVECAGGIGSILQSDKAPLNNKGIQQMQEAGVYLKIAGIRDGMSKIMYGHDTTRSIESVEVIANQLIDGNKIKKSKTTKLRTTKKGRTDEERIIENGKVFISTVELMKQIRERVNGHLEQGTTFILVGHRSNKSGIEEATGNIDEDLEISFDIENGEIIERDIDANTGKYIDPKKHPETLFLNRGNYKEILESLKNIPQFETAITMFNKNGKIEYEKYPIWELQNDVNAYIQRNPWIFSDLLKWGISSTYLRVFCLTKLILRMDFDDIENCYPLIGYIKLSKEEKKLLLQNTNDDKIMRIFRRLYLYRNNLWDSDDELLIQEYLPIKNYEELKNDQAIYQMATTIQYRSLDEEIKLGKNNAIIDQKVKLKDNEMERNITNDTIIQSADSYILPAMVGSGKSIWITNLVKEIIVNYPKKRVVFFEGSNWNNNTTLEEINNELKVKLQDRKNTILIIDAFDEIGSDLEKKRKLLANLKKEWSDIKIIITGRQSEFHETNNAPYKTLKLSFNKELFISQKGGIYRKEIRELLDSNFTQDDIIENPLLIFFICELANNAGRYSNLGILPLKEIVKISKQANKSLKMLLYENIIKLILTKHEQAKTVNLRKFGENKEENNERFQYIFETLSQLALRMAHNESYKTTLKRYGWSPVAKRDFFDAVNILFKKEDNSNYQFALKSLQEYFISYYRENSFGKNGKNKKEWKKILSESKSNILQEIITSIGYMNFEGFKEDISYLIDKKDKKLLMELIGSIGIVRNLEGIELLEKIQNLDTFKNDPELINGVCWAIEQIKYLKSLEFLKKIMDLDTFKNDPKLISSVCRAIRGIGHMLGINLLKEMLNLDSFKTNSKAIDSFCCAIGEIGDRKGLKLLEEVFKLGAFKEDAESIGSLCWAIGRIQDQRGMILLEKIIQLDAFWTSSETIEWFFWSIRQISSPKLSILILEEIEVKIINKPRAFYHMAGAYAYLRFEDKSMYYLELGLKYQQTLGFKNLQDQLNTISNDSDWSELKEKTGFQALIWKYNRILQDMP